MKILLTRKLHEFAMIELKKRYDLYVHSGEIPMPKGKLLSKISQADGLVCFPYDIIDKEIIENAKKLKVISTYSVGYDHIDLQKAKSHKIKIGYTPDVLTNATADLAVALLLDSMRRITEGDRMIRCGKWKVIFGPHDYVGTDMEGKTVGIFGMGRIGQAVAKRITPFGMKITYHSRHRLSKSQEKKLGAKYVSLDELFEKSDAVTVHVPYTKETHRIVDMRLLKKMKKTSHLINTSRGKIINEKDLVKALRSDMIAGAALDVFEREPIGKNHELAKMKNVVLVPHIGSSTDETRKKMAEITIKNLIYGLEEKKMIYSVNLD
ncbi:MAG: D-glycerate dehydrogenase [Thaumarchaeota archaeon]|nr:D-glycerate dehydrogenase [Nitrososphaerota archaeon]